jgi:type IV pilus assembly protein PilM
MARGTRPFESWLGLPDALSARFGSAGIGPIGFELGREHVRLLQLEQRGETLGLRALAVRPTPPGEGAPQRQELRDLVKEMLQDSPFRGRRVVTVLPDAGAKLMVLNYELAETADEGQHVLGLVQERIDEPIDQCVVDYRPIRMDSERGGPRSALVAVARQDDVVEYLELLRAAGLEVEALEIVPIAIHRLVAWLSREDLSSHSLVLHSGQRRTHLIGLAGRRLALYRDVEFGEATVVEALAKALDLDFDEARAVLERYGVWPDETGATAHEDVAQALEIAETVREILKPAASALADEIERAGVYTASQWRGARLDQLCLLGAFSRWPGIDRLLESLVSISTRGLDPVARLSGSEPEIANADAAVAMGLALRGLVEEG